MVSTTLNIAQNLAGALLNEVLRLNRLVGKGERFKEDGGFYLEARQKLWRITLDELAKHCLAKEDIVDITDINSKDIPVVPRRQWWLSFLPEKESFLRLYPEYSISIGVFDDDILQVGLVISVATGEMFSATRGSGAFCNDRRIRVNQNLSDNIASDKNNITRNSWVCSMSVPVARRRLAIMTQRGAQVRATHSSALDLVYLASGKLDAIWQENEGVHLQIGSLIAQEAGAILLDKNRNSFCLQSPDLIGVSHSRILPIMMR